MTPRHARALRGATAAWVATIVAATSHTMAGGGAPSLALVVSLGILTSPVAVLLVGRRPRAWRVGLTVLASQVFFHVAFALTASVDPDTAVLGHVLSFSATGFSPGEQVTASLDGGLAAVGPLTAGPSGEIAGVLQLPPGLEAGTHSLKVAGAASGLHPSANFPITAAPAPTARTAGTGHGRSWPPYAYLGGALVVLAGAVAFALLRRRRMTPSVTGASHA